MRDFFEEGVSAYERGDVFESCPLQDRSAEREEWQDGYRTAYNAFVSNHPEVNDSDEAPWPWENSA